MSAFHLDHNAPLALKGALIQLGHTAVTAFELGLAEASDAVHFRHSFDHDRIVLTHNRKDFRLLYVAWHDWLGARGLPTDHPGVIVLDPYPPGADVAIAFAIAGPMSRGWTPRAGLWWLRPGRGWRLADRSGVWGDWAISPTRS